jgi:hypothetical protein
MRTRNAAIAAALMLAVAGCGDDTSCPTETPQVSALAGSCVQVAGQPVSYPVRLCPTCNQTGATCDVDLSAVGAGSGDIFLDPKVEACMSSASCPPACEVNAITCTFTAPSTPGFYTVIAFDPVSGTTRESDLEVIASGPESCALAAATL